MTCNISYAFIQAPMPEVKDRDERVMMKIAGVLVNMLVQLNPEVYGLYVVYAKNRKVLYVQVMRAIYGMLEAALLWYKKFGGELEQKVFKFSPYDPCVANSMEKGLQQTLLFHVDDLKSSHKDRKVNAQFNKLLQNNYGAHGEVIMIHCGKIHKYLDMEIDFTVKGKVKSPLIQYVENVLKDLPEKIKSTDTALIPASDGLFKRKEAQSETHRCIPHHGCKSTIFMQACKTRHTAYNCCIVQEGQGPEFS
jgi:hypothetical protein